ncbi:exodeoxyribonuclease VII large subunit [Rahnella sp. SAP-1]|uniref:Exodeoxyribonuclease VII large subunit n=1 Tax=Rouxiella aceris TaxID=2703884 RepID=A0A848MPH6_9GAMM|nr:exodeoxyribonuclease VII large subunit [Rouxiella aceris]NMP28979.1 exodeoxyribonuclease VII large subunit [Rouxiella aceris]
MTDFIYLNTSYQDKDKVKALGAKWDPDFRRWRIPADTADLHVFSPWLSAEITSTLTPANNLDLPAPLESSLSPTIYRPDGITLSVLLKGVEDVVNQTFAQGVWTIVEVVNVKIIKENVYLDLCERDPQGNELVKAVAIIWSKQAAVILPKYQQITGSLLGPGIKLLVRAKPHFTARWGFKLQITEIDPAFTLGDLEARKQRIRVQLQQQGIWKKNKQLSLPWDYQDILVIAPQNAAGLGDFQTEAKWLQSFNVCNFEYVHSLFQGHTATAEIRQKLKNALDSRTKQGIPLPDIIVIIRGGGSVNDLAWLNDFELCRDICLLPIPVLTGIGHEKDSTVLDEVACYAFDTPSKVIGSIIQNIKQRTSEARELYASVINYALRIKEDALREITLLSLENKAAALSILEKSRHALLSTINNIQQNSLKHIAQSRHITAQHYQLIKLQSTKEVSELKSHLPYLLLQVKNNARANIALSRREASDITDYLWQESGRKCATARAGTSRLFTALENNTEKNTYIARQNCRNDMTSLQENALRLVYNGHNQIRSLITGISEKTKTDIRQLKLTLNQEVRFNLNQVGYQLTLSRHKTQGFIREITGQGPEKTLRRGFTIIQDEKGKPVTSSKITANKITIQFYDGSRKAIMEKNDDDNI